MKVYLVVVETLADWEVGYLTAELHSRRFFANPLAPFEQVLVGLTQAPVRSMGGMALTPDLTLDEVRMEQGDLLLLPGSDIWDQPQAKAALAFARARLEEGHNVAAICGATNGLAQVGALNEHAHTSNDLDFLKQTCPDYQGAERYRHEPAVRDRNLITATGLAPLEFSYEVFKLLDVLRPATLEAWYQLHKTREAKWFYALMESMGSVPERD
ncbi:type 1 glutamine amidotransferase family protein [Massilia sp. YMA4]|uniref:type 1 glutamine amidotransferase family protein n=1 Tax=Massilia sp. YMA4 TaxID=1593482 RepID=UPI000DD159DB|nr:type 1 glutamine amidotransferase family protein [Massilia sp. YMA4]AXA90966.1 glutamine amidotransferase [Massilia sp. YMA4]